MADGCGYWGNNFAFIIFLILILLFFGQGFGFYGAEK
ncbi:hypothetical protein Desca_2021 [Desulfotomaculum nigrificans CO-1-SRB]|uniref:Uncharacterized protein n=1 Tax=Desulfotomaculum nigrificans (strain DSM 14880 / VKM B-2319 / CO-1-SRB) TaxID=868595 RepID=F6B988_DESCC|nr:hypothetical protein Desca_2021 [Desulfotomaculum nigrificans CO-1-SRB]